MKVKDYSEFVISCNKGFCLRGTMYNTKTCITESKQKSCYPKYITKLEKLQSKQVNAIVKKQEQMQKVIDNNFKDQIDVKWEEIKKEVWARDVPYPFPGTYTVNKWIDYCTVWNSILTREEKIYVLQNFKNDIASCSRLSNMHIESRQRSPKLIYDVSNIILAGDYFHSLYDNYFDLVTRELIKEDRRKYWEQRFKNYTKEFLK